MIRPNVRASFGRTEAEILTALAGPDGDRRLREEGIDALLDDALLLRRLLEQETMSGVPAPLLFYLMVRHALLEREVVDREMADYTAALLLEFGRLDRAYRASEGDPDRFFYLTDILSELERARGDREFELRVHLGNFALWMAGVFPDHITHRVQRKGGPPLSYYDSLGASGFRAAAQTQLALRHNLGGLFLNVADQFPDVRGALNSLSDALFFPRAKNPTDRLLRQVRQDFLRAMDGG